MKMIKVTLVTKNGNKVRKFINPNYIGIINDYCGGSQIILAMNYSQGCYNPSYVYEVEETPEQIIQMIDE